MTLHENKNLFTQAIRATATYMQMSEIYIEKDYWITLALQIIYTNDIGKETVFKGGTSLSKCYGLIHRLSEDIDLVIFKRETETNAALTKKIRSISKLVEQVLPEIEVEGITNKKGMNRKTAHTYPKKFDGDYGQVRKTIILEATWLGHFEPYVKHRLHSYVYEMMASNDQYNIIKQYNLEPFDAWVLDVRRTICEKIMSLVRFSYANDPIIALANKVRHTYDLHLLLEHNVYSDFIDSLDFESLMQIVANDDVNSFKNNNDWLKHHPSKALIFKDIEGTWSHLENTYLGSFATMVYRDLPTPDNIKGTLHRIAKRLDNLKNWTTPTPS